MLVLNKSLRILIFFLCIIVFHDQLRAQSWDPFDTILSQLDSAQRSQYLKNLNTMPPTSTGLNVPLDSLNKYIASGINPATGVIPLIPPFSIASDSLRSSTQFLGLDSVDNASLQGQLSTVLGSFQLNQDSLVKTFGQNQTRLQTAPTVPINSLEQRTFDFANTLAILKIDQQNSFDPRNNGDLGNMSGLLRELFNRNTFTAIEIFAGKQQSNVNFYNISYKTDLPVVGIRSVEQFNKLIEPRWRAQGSWFGANTVAGTNNELSFQKNSPFMLNASIEMMYNPQVTIAGQSVRILSLLGIDAALYAPAHRMSGIVATSRNVGNTTGWGPIVGTGLSTTVGNTTVYTITTVSYGDVVTGSNAALTNYKYRSFRAEAGVKVGNLAVIRYEISAGNQWARDNNKRVGYQQLTLGLPLTGLFR
jgi:hypothetical protein